MRKIVPGTGEKIPENATVTLVKAGETARIQYIKHTPQPPPVRRLPAGAGWVRTDTGEIYQASGQKSLTSNLRKTIEKMRDTINTNFTGAQNELLATVTYADNMQDPDKLYKDIKAYIAKLRRRIPGELIYIIAVEPQERGALHAHLLLKWLELPSAIIPQEVQRKIWPHGISQVQRITGIDNVGAYLSAYLLNTSGKKGARLHLYPPGMRIWRASRNAARPEEIRGKYADIKKQLGAGTPSCNRAYIISTDDGQALNLIVKEYWGKVNKGAKNVDEKAPEKGINVTINGNINVKATNIYFCPQTQDVVEKSTESSTKTQDIVV